MPQGISHTLALAILNRAADVKVTPADNEVLAVGGASGQIASGLHGLDADSDRPRTVEDRNVARHLAQDMMPG
jgi:hypothetical protein